MKPSRTGRAVTCRFFVRKLQMLQEEFS